MVNLCIGWPTIVKLCIGWLGWFRIVKLGPEIMYCMAQNRQIMYWRARMFQDSEIMYWMAQHSHIMYWMARMAPNSQIKYWIAQNSREGLDGSE